MLVMLISAEPGEASPYSDPSFTHTRTDLK